MKFRKLFVAASFILGFTVGTLGVETYERSVFQPWQWDDAPIIANCYGGDFNELYIVKAVDYWTTLGYDFAFIEQNPPDAVCDHDLLDGFIILKKKTLSPDTLALTKRKVRTFNIRAATIYFNPGSYRLVNVIEHELGHALGFGHVEIDGHIMHPQFDKMSPKFWIPN